MTSVPILHTDRCTLSGVSQSDIPVLRQILDDSETQRFLPELCKEFRTTESLQQFVSSFDKYLFQDEGILWGIHIKDTLIGFIAIMDMTTNPTLFYAMHPDSRNNGYMKECIKASMRFVNEVKLCLIIQSEVYCDNVISTKLLTNLNFKLYKQSETKVYYTTYLNNSRDFYNTHSK